MITPGLIQRLIQLRTLTGSLLLDFITDAYWPKYYTGVDLIKKADAVSFLKEASFKGCHTKEWSDAVIDKTTRGLLGCLSDFANLVPGKYSTFLGGNIGYDFNEGYEKIVDRVAVRSTNRVFCDRGFRRVRQNHSCRTTTAWSRA